MCVYVNDYDFEFEFLTFGCNLPKILAPTSMSQSESPPILNHILSSTF